MNRRQVLFGMGAAAGAAIVGTILLRDTSRQASSVETCAQAAEIALPPEDKKGLEALCDTLLPSFAGQPGAAELGVWTYIARELAKPRMSGLFQLIKRGAVELDRMAQQKFAKTFVALNREGQNDVILAMAQGQGAVPGFMPNRFVVSMLGLVLEGALSDPSHGGNRDGLGWRSIGYMMHPPVPGHSACGH